VSAGSAEGAAESDFAAAFEHGDDHDVGDPDRADQERDGTKAEQQSGELVLPTSIRMSPLRCVICSTCAASAPSTASG
jgi:hypothetical protein